MPRRRPAGRYPCRSCWWSQVLRSRSFPRVPGYEIEPDLVLAVLLPPLLFAVAFESSAVAIRKLLRPIFQLAVVLVLLTAFTVAIVLTALIPAIPFAAALALR